MGSFSPARRLRPAHLALALFTLSAACLQGARAPQVAPRGTLAPGGDEAGSADASSELAVVFGAPKGETLDPSEVTLVFNRPMRALDLAGSEATPPVVMRPAAPGRWQWVGTSALQFVPEGHLAHGTAFAVEVPAGVKALDGKALARPYKLAFTTARPALVSTTPGDGATDLEPSARLVVRFNQPVADAELVRAVSLFVGAKEERVLYDVRRKDPKNELEAELAPRGPLPLDAPLALRVDESLKGTEGPLPAGKAGEVHLHTYGPLGVKALGCDESTPHRQCASDGGITLELTNPVKLGDLKKALTIEPKVKITWPTWLDDAVASRDLPINARFLPGKRYTVRLKGGAMGPRDEHGQALASDWSKDIPFDDLWPVAAIGVTGSYLEPGARRDVPIGSVNLASYELAVAALDERGVLELETQGQYGLPSFAGIARAPGAKVSDVHKSAARNATAEERVRTEDALGGKDRRGPVAIGIRYTARPGTRAARIEAHQAIVQVTDLGISAKVSRRGSFVWVTRLSTGAPVAGASVSIRTPDAPNVDVFKTDAEGFATVPATSWVPGQGFDDHAVVFARTEGDFAYRRVASQVSGYRFGVSVASGEERPFGMIFSDRGIYRPGDVVHLKGILREEAHPGTATPSGRPVNVRVETPEGEVLAESRAIVSAFGTFAVDVKVPATSKLGTYAVEASLEPAPKGVFDVSGDFEVAEYRAAEFSAAVQSSRPSYVEGDAASWTARGDFLFGAPMAGADVRFTVTHATTTFTPPGLPEGFVADQEAYVDALPDSSPHEAELASSRGKLDARGAASIDVKLAIPGARGPEQVTCEAEVTDLSRQTISGSTTAIVHPADVYAAVDVGSELFVPSGQKVKPKVLVVDLQGKPVAGRPVTVELLRRTWLVAKQSAGGGGYHSVVTPNDQRADLCTVKSAATPEACELTPTQPGLYVVRVTTVDGKQRAAAAASVLYVTSDGPGEGGWGDSDKMAVELVPDRKSYQVGQTARVLVKSPFSSADALVTVERSGVYSRRRVKLSGATPTLEIPITADLRPNAFVSVLLLRGRSALPPGKATSRDVGAPSFRLGYASLAIDPEARRLGVRVASNKGDYRPGESIDVDVDVRDKAGKPARAELTLYAVDEGVLSLVAYKTPDPIPVFGAPRALGVATLEARQAIARVANPFGALGLDKGLDGGDGASGQSVRRDFRPSAFYAAAIVTDPAGRARASFKLPDGLTTYRIMAVAAAEDDRFGFGEARVTTSRPLMARPAFPRILRAGDVLEAGVVVTSKGLAAAKIEVEITAEGLVLGSEKTRTIDLPANGSLEVRFPMEAREVGRAKVRFKVRGGGAEDAVELTRDVLAPIAPEAVALYGDTSVASAEKLGDLSAIRGDVGGLELSLSSTALIGLGDGVQQLVEYPYGCTEQLTSRLVPALPLRDLARDYAIPLPPGIDAMVEKTVGKILANQRGDGGFGLWADSPTANGWVTAYALWGLSEAKRRGVAVPISALQRATRFVRGELEHMDKDLFAFATAPFVLDVLAMNAEPDPGRASRLFEDRERLPLFSQALLLHAMVVGKADSASVEKLASELEGHVRLDGATARAVGNTGDRYAVLMDSDARTSALVLRALVAARPSHPLASKLATGLLAARRGGSWRSTQETAWALLSLDDYRKAQEAAPPSFVARVFLGDAEIHAASFKERSVKQDRDSIPSARLASAGGAPLSFSVEGKGRLYYEARLRYAKKEMPRKPLDRGFFVQKTLRPVSAAGLSEAVKSVPGASISAFVGGDLVLADVVVVTPSPRDFVVIDDPLPAGFEAVDARLATTGRSVDVDAAAAKSGADEPADDDAEDDARATGRAYEPSWFLKELRDDRVLFFVDHMAAGMYHYRYLARATSLGTFVLPPTRAEQMYAPEVFGRSAADAIKVSAKP